MMNNIASVLESATSVQSASCDLCERKHWVVSLGFHSAHCNSNRSHTLNSYMPDLEFILDSFLAPFLFCFAVIHSEGLRCVKKSDQGYGSC